MSTAFKTSAIFLVLINWTLHPQWCYGRVVPRSPCPSCIQILHLLSQIQFPFFVYISWVNSASLGLTLLAWPPSLEAHGGESSALLMNGVFWRIWYCTPNNDFLAWGHANQFYQSPKYSLSFIGFEWPEIPSLLWKSIVLSTIIKKIKHNWFFFYFRAWQLSAEWWLKRRNSSLKIRII